MEKIKELYNKYKEILMYLIFGVFGACSTFVESMCLGSICIESFAECKRSCCMCC